MTLTFPWSLSINTLVLLCRVMREWKVGFVGVFLHQKRNRDKEEEDLGGSSNTPPAHHIKQAGLNSIRGNISIY